MKEEKSPTKSMGQLLPDNLRSWSLKRTKSNGPTRTPLYETYDTLKNNDLLKTLAILSAHVYDKSKIDLPDGCILIRSHESSSGLKAKLYILWSGEYICAFAGTSAGKDHLENLMQCIGASKQYQEALDFAKLLTDIYPSEIIFTGHSQGGGEAAYCAFSLGAKAYTFNPAGLSTFTSLKIPKDKATAAEVHSYIFGPDVLNLLQNTLPEMHIGLKLFFDIRADGFVHYVKDYHPVDINLREMHGMGGILRYLGV